MMSAEENKRFTQVGPETPMGDLLRRYWHPIAGAAELDDNPIKPVRILGEDLVLYRDKSGTYGLVDRRCPHRGTDLSYGIIEECGLRCSYHGWKFGENGDCLEQPYEDIANPKARFKDKIKIKAYEVRAQSGMLFVYMGPAPAPQLPIWESMTWENGFQQIVLADVSCNWFQCQENSCDPVHFEWMHRNWAARQKDDNADYGPKHLDLQFEEFEFGHIYKRIREDTDTDSDHWTVGTASLFPNIFFLGDHIEWRVPVDDENTLSVTWAFNPVPKDRRPFIQDRIPCWKGPVKDANGRWITSHVMNQDFVGWAGQGVVTDRTKEHLGKSDKGILMMRKAFRASLAAIANGGDPKGLVRDPERAKNIKLPIKNRIVYQEALTLEEIRARAKALAYNLSPDEYPFQYGMPEGVKREYQQAIGILD